MAFDLAVPVMELHDFGMKLSKALVVVYNLLKLTGIGTIAVFAVLIYQRMPLTYREYSKIKADRPRFNDVAGSRLPVVFIPGTVKVCD